MLWRATRIYATTTMTSTTTLPTLTSTLGRSLRRLQNARSPRPRPYSSSASVAGETRRAAPPTPPLAVGATVHGFVVTDVVELADFDCRLVRLEHAATGARYAHVDRDDPNNVFAVAFRTTPFDSTGLPHILEHVALMGSARYPCRDPFFKMLNRSLATYVNACTGADYTVYPFATQNRADYYNLMSVYLDAVFRPTLRANDFRMEGWRLEHDDVEDARSPIVFKGVVFNEMKGVFSENQNVFAEAVLNNLLPGHTYGVCSGGDPADIPRLEHGDLVAFHRDHYHPSNCRLYSYGNFDPTAHLKFVHENYLRQYERHDSLASKTRVPREPRWSQPRRKHIAGRHDPLAADSAKQSTIAVSYLCDDVRNVRQQFELRVLCQLLTDGPNAAFYKSLVEPADLGSGYAPATGFDGSTRDTNFTIGLQGCSADDFGRIEQIVYDTFDECVRVGFDEAFVESILHGVELATKHQGSDIGLNLMFGVASLWNHDGDVAEYLKTTEHVAQLRKSMADDPRYLQRLVEKYFTGNPHRLILTMSPDPEYENQRQEAENQLLSQKLLALTEEERKRVYDVGLELRREQEQPQDVSCLPTLHVSDIEKRPRFPAIGYANEANCRIQLCTVPTNNVTYFRALLDVSALADHHIERLPLFALVLSQMGTRRSDYRDFDRQVYAKTLGLNVALHVHEDAMNAARFEQCVSLGSLCLDRNADDMFELWSRLLTEASFADADRFATLVRNAAADVANGVADAGHRYAAMYARAGLSAADALRERFGGLTYVRHLKRIAAADDLGPLRAQMAELVEVALRGRRMRAALNATAEQADAAVAGAAKLVVDVDGRREDAVPTTASEPPPPPFDGAKRVHFVLPFAVNYAAKATRCAPFAHPDFGALLVLAKLLTAKYLLPVVRERYGAYGAGAQLSVGGALQFYSYRDPNATATAAVFDEAGAWLRRAEFGDGDVDEAKLAVFRDVDAPVAASEQGMRAFLYGVDDQLFADHRSRILAVTRDDVMRVGAAYLDGERRAVYVLIGPDNAETKDWEKIFSD